LFEGDIARKEYLMFGLGGQELVIVLLIVLVLFGGAKIPQMMRGMGEGMREFKKATRDDDDDTNTKRTTV
jgi:sec-independent protein translocase protein TatA